MSELKLPRLLAAAKEFNVGQDTLVDFLANKGFNRDELKPTAKLTEEMYLSLQREFQGDKVAKTKADQIEIPKGAGGERRKKEEEEPVFKKEEPKVEKQPEVVAQQPAPPPAPVADIPAPAPAPVVAPPPAPVAEPEIKQPVVAEITKIEAPELEGPKTLGKIDLAAIDSSTRPKKIAKKPQEEPAQPPVVEETPEVAEIAEEKVQQPQQVVAEKIEEEAPVAEAQEIDEPEDEPAETTSVIENIKAEKLEGPKILGKIELPVDNDTRPKPSFRGNDEKRKRKRIPIDKKSPHPGGGEGAGAGDRNRGAGAGAGTGDRNRRPEGAPNRENRPALQIQKVGDSRGGAHPQHGRGGGNRNDRRAGGGRDHRREDKEIDQKEIQEKIRETQAKLAGSGGRGKSLKAKHRREKRQEMADAQGDMMDDNKLQVTEFVTVSELAGLMDVSFTEVISKCMSLGIMVSINQRLDAEVIELVASEFGYEVEFTSVDEVEEDEEEDIDSPEELVPRPPVVTIMGHVDHGKTSLLDYIRSANVVAGEAGGITQHIGAYQVQIGEGKKITFLDTPGHEAFTAMRARGAKAADVAVIVVAADDAVMPQTKEAISHAQAAGLPMIFAINKIDKDGANPTKIYEQLSQMNILVEEWGGKFQSQELSAKKGLNVDLLLEKILLEAELLDLKANPEKEGVGTIIEASLDKGRGYVATVLVQNGTLNQGDIMVSGQYYGRVKAMFNERNQRSEAAPPSSPVQILGLNGAPQAGEKFKVYVDESEAKDVAIKRAQISREQGLRARKHITLDEIGRRLALGNFKQLNLIIKGDVDGSVEALSDSLQKLSTEEIVVQVILKGVGQISESDVVLATASDAIIVAFNVRPSLQAARLAENEGVQIKAYSIIYNAIEEIKSAMEGMLEPKIQEKIVANVEIREVYKFDKATVAGCFVLDGRINRTNKVRIIRDGIVVYPTGEGASAELASLKRYKDDVKDVLVGMECGLTIKNYNDIKVGDIVEAYEEEEVKRTL
ncbi:translation initiation factor IF-2 [Panacibacter sp. DH6]|uniref:Translation initiation factor IF-2 n=1 Tax=Panacibacter microcysteis TaxID=2793269 RepID=A0A931E8E8_9BACT|nr:translation initiation factor IF-2 [Panacibacter microcysteis]MBG9375631.1 translation initiation factor IF-2 [Panacibacter microcysteis]